jgi:hypothetical protein
MEQRGMIAMKSFPRRSFEAEGTALAQLASPASRVNPAVNFVTRRGRSHLCPTCSRDRKPDRAPERSVRTPVSASTTRRSCLGGVLFAPAMNGDKVFVGSDDGTFTEPG